MLLTSHYLAATAATYVATAACTCGTNILMIMPKKCVMMSVKRVAAV